MSAEQMNSRNRLQLIRETTPGVYNSAGERLTMTCLRGDFQPDEAWASFRPDGFNEDAWHARERTHRIWSGAVRWDWKQTPVLLRMLCGAPATDVTAGGKRTRTYTLPESGPRNLTGATQTLEFGAPDDCERCTYGMIVSISLPAERMGDTVEGQITVICRKPVATGAVMTGGGGTLANDVFTVTITNADGDRVLTFYDADGTSVGTVTILTTDTGSDVQNKVRALGAPFAAATVSEV